MSKVILIADDDENDAFAVSQTLINVGVRNPLITVNDGTEAISYFTGKGQYADRERFPLPAVLLLDLKMRRIDGFFVMEWLNQQYKSLHSQFMIVVLTGHGELENVRRAYGLGARSFLTKPCTMDDIQNLVHGYPAYWEFVSPKESVALSSRCAGPAASAST